MRDIRLYFSCVVIGLFSETLNTTQSTMILLAIDIKMA